MWLPEAGGVHSPAPAPPALQPDVASLPAGTRVLVGEADESRDRTLLGHGIRVGDEHVLAPRGRDPG